MIPALDLSEDTISLIIINSPILQVKNILFLLESIFMKSYILVAHQRYIVSLFKYVLQYVWIK